MLYSYVVPFVRVTTSQVLLLVRPAHEGRGLQTENWMEQFSMSISLIPFGMMQWDLSFKVKCQESGLQ